MVDQGKSLVDVTGVWRLLIEENQDPTFASIRWIIRLEGEVTPEFCTALLEIMRTDSRIDGVSQGTYYTFPFVPSFTIDLDSQTSRESLADSLGSVLRDTLRRVRARQS